MPEYAVETEIFVQPVADIEEGIQEAKDQLEIYSSETNISHWKFDKKTSEMSDSIAIIDATIYVVADDPDEAGENVEQQLAYLGDTKVTGWEVRNVRKRPKPRAMRPSARRRPEVRVK